MDGSWILDGGSYLGITIFMILTGAGLPLPEEVAIVFAGVQSGRGALDPLFALIALMIGALVGDAIMYGIGYRLGMSRLRRHPWVAKFFHLEREKQMERAIARHGIKVFFLARFMVGVRGPMYIAAGILRVPFRKFVVVDFFCATLVVGFFFGLSWWFGDAVLGWIQRGEKWLTAAVLGGAIVAGVIFAWFKWRAVRMSRTEAVESLEREANSPEGEQETGERGALAP